MNRGTKMTDAQRASRRRARVQGGRGRIKKKRDINPLVSFTPKPKPAPAPPGSRDCRVLVQGGQITELGRRVGYRPKHLKTNIPFPTEKEIAAAKARQRMSAFN